MASDFFLKLEGITGESTDTKFAGQIEIESFTLGASQAAMSSTSAVGGMTGARADLTDLTITKVLDKSSPTLFNFCTTGKHIKTATLSICGANEAKEVYLQYDLTEVVVSSITTGGASGGIRPNEQVSLRFATIKEAYTPYASDGTKGAAIKASWDTVKNTVVSG
jgi:type VI secretion system secreted protein Hcp